MTTKRNLQPTQPRKPSSPVSGLAMFYGLLIVLMFLFPPPYSAMPLGVMIAIAIFLALRQTNLIERVLTWTTKILQRYPLIGEIARKLTLILMLGAAFLFSVGGQAMAETAVPWMLVGGVALAAALVSLKLERIAGEHDRAHEVAPVKTRTRWLPLIAGVGLLAALAEINGGVFSPTFLDRAPSWVQFVLLVVGPLLLAWGIGGRQVLTAEERAEWLVKRQKRETVWSREMLFSPTVIAFALIMAAGAAARFWQLGEAIPLFVDEIHFTKPLLLFYVSDNIGLVMPFSSVAAFPYLYPYMQWLGVEIFGRDLVGLRVVSAAFGVLTIPALYLLARELFDRKTALIAAALLAVFPPHIQFSRLGLNNIADPFFGTLALYFIARGLKPERDMRLNFALAGAMIGLTQYFYEGGRLLFPALAVGWLAVMGVGFYGIMTARIVWAGLEREREGETFSRLLAQINRVDYGNLFKSGLALIVAAALVGAPVYYTLASKDLGLAVRMETAGLGEVTLSRMMEPDGFIMHFINRLNESFLIHVSIPESKLYYAGSTPFILGMALPFFLIGGLYCMWCVLRGRHYAGALLLLLWVLLTWLGNTLMQESRISARYVVEFPALMLILAVGVRCVAALVWPQNPRHQNRLVVGLVAALMALHVVYYFGAHLPRFNQQFRDSMIYDAHDALLRSVDFPPDTHVFLISTYTFRPGDATDLLRYLNPELRVFSLAPDEMDTAYMQTLIAARPRAFFVEPGNTVMVERLRQFFPDLQGPFYSERDIPMRSQYALYWSGRRSEMLFDAPE